MILVTGGAGFIGSVIARELNKSGRNDLIITDTAGTPVHANLKNISFEQYFEAYDFLTKLNQVFPKLDYVIHMGACSSTTERDEAYLTRNNLEYSIRIFEAARRFKVPLIYASSAATYGDGEEGYSDDHSATDRLHPMNPYAHSKHHFDQWVLRQTETPPLWFGIKFFNVFGPNEYHKGHMRSIVHKAFGQIQEKGTVNLFRSHKEGYQDGWQLRDFVYVLDCAKAILQMMELKDPTKSAIYNMGTGKARSFYDLVAAVFSSLGRETRIEYMDMPEDVREQYQYYTQAEMDKFQGLLPEFQFRRLEDSVRDYIVEYLNRDDPHL